MGIPLVGNACPNRGLAGTLQQIAEKSNKAKNLWGVP